MMTRRSELRRAALYAAVTLFYGCETVWAIHRDLAGYAVACAMVLFGFSVLTYATYRRSRTL